MMYLFTKRERSFIFLHFNVKTKEINCSKECKLDSSFLRFIRMIAKLWDNWKTVLLHLIHDKKHCVKWAWKFLNHESKKNTA